MHILAQNRTRLVNSDRVDLYLIEDFSDDKIEEYRLLCGIGTHMILLGSFSNQKRAKEELSFLALALEHEENDRRMHKGRLSNTYIITPDQEETPCQ